MKNSKHLRILIVSVVAFSLVLLTNDLFAKEKNKSAASYTAYFNQLKEPYFFENKGQIKSKAGAHLNDIMFYGGNNKVKYYLANNGFSLVFTKAKNKLNIRGKKDYLNKKLEDIKYDYNRIEFELAGAKSNPAVITEYKSSFALNYYNENKPKGVSVYGYEKITYKNIYDKIDFVIYHDSSGLKYDFIVHPGGNPLSIKMKRHGALPKPVADGSMEYAMPLAKLMEKAPVTYQLNQSSEIKEIINCNYVIEKESVMFNVNRYDSKRDMVIDPKIIWYTYYDGNNDDFATCIGEDVVNSGNEIYVAGATSSTTGIATSGAYQGSLSGSYDGFLAELNNAGTSLLSATYFGGAYDDIINSIYIDYSQSYLSPSPKTFLYFVGNTQSTSGISTVSGSTKSSNTDYDAFLGKFEINISIPSLVWSRYYGGTDDDFGNDVASDIGNSSGISGDPIITGTTYSTNTSSNYIATSGAYSTSLSGSSDAFLAKFDQSWGNRSWGTYYGDYSASYGNALSINRKISGNGFGYTVIYFVGGTNATYTHSFVSAINGSGTSINWSNSVEGNLYCIDYADTTSRSVEAGILVGGEVYGTAGVKYDKFLNTPTSSGLGACILKYKSWGGPAWGKWLDGNCDSWIDNIQIYDFTSAALNEIYYSGYNCGNSALITQTNDALFDKSYVANTTSNSIFGILDYDANLIFATKYKTKTIISYTIDAGNNADFILVGDGGSADVYIANFSYKNCTFGIPTISPNGTMGLCNNGIKLTASYGFSGLVGGWYIDRGVGYELIPGATTSEYVVTEPGKYIILYGGYLVSGCAVSVNDISEPVVIEPELKILDYYDKNLVSVSYLYVSDASAVNNSSYQWYKDGAAIFGANNSYYSPTIAGEYYVEAVNSCISGGSSYTVQSNVIKINDNISCSGSSLTSLSSGTYSGTYYVSSHLTVSSGQTVTFNSATLYLAKDITITVESGGTLSINSATHIEGCNHNFWTGINVEGSGVLNISGSSVIKDAYTAIYSKAGGDIQANSGVFENNFVHIYISAFTGNHPASINNCTFNNTNIYNRSLLYGENIGTASKMIMLDGINSVNISNCSFDGGNTYGTGNYRYGIEANDVYDITINNNTFDGYLTSGIYARNCTNLSSTNTITIKGNTFGSGSGTSTATSHVRTGVTLSLVMHSLIGSTGSAVDKNIFYYLTNGIEYYFPYEGGYNSAHITDISHNEFYYNKYSIVTAFGTYPITEGLVTSSAGTYNSFIYSTSSTTLKVPVNIFCNKIQNNDYGIIGSGYLIPQGSSSALDASNNFDAGSPASTNNYADILHTGIFTYYYLTSSATYSSTLGAPTTSISGTISIDFSSVNSSGISISNSTSTSCYPSWKRANAIADEDNETNLIKYYPVPFHDYLKVDISDSEPGEKYSIKIMDITGRMLIQQTSSNKNIEINTAELPAGVYNFTVYNSSKTVKTQTIVKY